VHLPQVIKIRGSFNAGRRDAPEPVSGQSKEKRECWYFKYQVR
jgi:hypothetical protein